MRKFLATCLCSLFMSLSLFAQDIIITTAAQKIEAKILEVTKTEIKYKELDNLEGPTFILSVEDINSIIYANGKVELYNNTQSADNSEPESTARENAAQAVIVDFDIERTSDPLMYRFINLSSGATDFRWDFGDGAFGFAKDEAMYRFENKGTYTITLTATVDGRQYIQRKILEIEDHTQQDPLAAATAMLVESGVQLGKAIQDLEASKNSYALDIINKTKNPYRINLDGHILGVVNPYKTKRFIVSVEIYGRMQAVQTSGYAFSPTIKEYKIPRQQKQTACRVVIK